VDRTVKELTLVSVFAVLALGLAWAQEQEVFALFFAAAAVIAGMEAARRSL
jgi:hypothetical protein